jgi:membrane-bound serine protease (ClpP class)
MSPFTITGSSQPVAFDPVSGSQPINDTKTLNALTAYIEERARLHGRNETAARDFVLKNLNLNEELALRYGVIEIVAGSLPELLVKLNAMQVETIAGTVTIDTRNVSVENYTGSIRLRLLEVISDPILASIALLIGIYAVIFGLSAPGHMAEIIGAFLLIVGLIGIGLNISLGALLLLAVGAILMIAEAYSPTHGALATAGLVFVVIGSLLLVPFESSRWIISVGFYQTFVFTVLAASSIIGAFTIFMVYKVLRARRLKPAMGKIIGEKVKAVDDLTPGKEGYVKYYGEYWRAKSHQEIKAGSSAIVVDKEGPLLTVKPVDE